MAGVGLSVCGCPDAASRYPGPCLVGASEGPGLPDGPTARPIARLPQLGTCRWRPALACRVRLSSRPPRGPGPCSARSPDEGRGLKPDLGPMPQAAAAYRHARQEAASRSGCFPCCCGRGCHRQGARHRPGERISGSVAGGSLYRITRHYF